MKKIEYKIDMNTLLLHGVLEAMTMYKYNDEIKHNLNNFILYLEKFLFKHECDNDILDEELIHIVTYEEENANL